MKKMNVAFAVMLALSSVASAHAGRTIVCSVADSAPTIAGIRSLKYYRGDSQVGGSVTIVRDGSPEAKTSWAQFSGSALSWGESKSYDGREGNFATEDSLVLQKFRGEKGPSSFSLMRTLSTLSGPHCDGYESCRVSDEIVQTAEMSCTDSDDLLPANPDSSHNCDLPGDC